MFNVYIEIEKYKDKLGLDVEEQRIEIDDEEMKKLSLLIMNNLLTALGQEKAVDCDAISLTIEKDNI